MRKNIRAGALVAAVAALLTGGAQAADPPKQPKDAIKVVNDSSTEVNVRVRFWQKGYVKVSVGKKADVRFDAQSRTIQVEARSRKWNDSCWVTMQVGETLRVKNGIERIACEVQ